jgi:hypothetical protein
MISEISREQNDYFWQVLQNRLNEQRISKAFEFMESYGFQPILIKGRAAARYYPESWMRQFADIDLCVEPKAYERAKKVLETSQGKTHNIDLHKGLRHLDTVAWDDLFDNCIELEIEDKKVRTLRAEDHLRVLCVHWLSDGGAYKNRLWDIYYLVENRPADFDWQRCLEIVGPKRKKWITSCIGLAHKYLGLNIESVPSAGQVLDIPEWLMRAVENEWKTEVRLLPIQGCLRDRKIFWQQVKKRIPPNPVQATIELEGSFDDSPRYFYQFGNVFTRLFPSVKRVMRKLSEDL